MAVLAGATLTALGGLLGAYITGRQADRDRASRERQAALDRLYAERVRAYLRVSRALNSFDYGVHLPVRDPLYEVDRARFEEGLDDLHAAADEAQLVCSLELWSDLRHLVGLLRRAQEGRDSGDAEIDFEEGLRVVEKVRKGMRQELGAPYQ